MRDFVVARPSASRETRIVWSEGICLEKATADERPKPRDAPVISSTVVMVVVEKTKGKGKGVEVRV